MEGASTVTEPTNGVHYHWNDEELNVELGYSFSSKLRHRYQLATEA